MYLYLGFEPERGSYSTVTAEQVWRILFHSLEKAYVMWIKYEEIGNKRDKTITRMIRTSGFHGGPFVVY